MELTVTNDEKQNFSNRLNKVLDRAGVPPKGKGRQGVVAKLFGVSQKGARKWLEAEAIPESAKIPKFISVFSEQKITGEWLFYGNQDYAPDWITTAVDRKKPNQSYTNVINEPEVKGEVPEVSFAQIGEWSETSFNLLPVDGVRMIKSRVPAMARTFAVTVEGDSMEPEFVEGDTIIVEPSLAYKHKSYVIAKNGKDVFLRQIVKEGSDWLLKPLNKRYDILPLGEYQIVGVIREKAKFYE